jgi:crossover junction endodeoxyribonuclease RuvC
VIILGIDPGLRHTGWGIIKTIGSSLKFIAAGTISPDTKLAMSERIFILHQELNEIIKIYAPEEVALEEVFCNNNAATSLKLGQARGAIILCIAINRLLVHEYSTRLIKKSVVGVGAADKNQVQQMVQILLKNAVIESHDASDALATAICHAHLRKSNMRL